MDGFMVDSNTSRRGKNYWREIAECDYEMEDGGCWAVANDNSSPDKRFKLGAMLDSSIEAINERFEQQLLPELKQWAEANGIMLEDW